MGFAAPLFVLILAGWTVAAPDAFAQSPRGVARAPRDPPLPPPRPREPDPAPAQSQSQSQSQSQPQLPAPQPQASAPAQEPRDTPLPPRRPREPESAQAPSPQPQEPAPADDGECRQTLRERGVDFTAVAGKTNGSQMNGGQNGACSIADPVSFKSVKLASGRIVALDAAVTLRCEFAGALALWIQDDLDPALARHGMTLKGLSGVGGQECRGRNGQKGAPISEHASGNAFDVRRLTVEGGAPVKLMSAPPANTRALREEIRASACARFPTVLGSGADGFHEDHLHIDLRERRGGYRLCQWDVR